jgi:hypothetical protein
MKKPGSVKALEAFGRVRLSPNFFMRDFLYSEIANYYAMPNIPDNPDLAIEVGRHLCIELLEPLNAQFGRLAIRSAYRSCTVNAFGNQNRLNCARNESNYGNHIWDRVDANGNKGAMACVASPRFADHLARGGDWQTLAWWIHDHLPYSTLEFYPKLGAFNISWHEQPQRRIDSHINPKGTLTKPGMANHAGRHDDAYKSTVPGTVDLFR